MKLIFENVSKSYGNTRALTDFSLTMEPGIHALLGPNGSGKSTLMKIITDNLKADAGKILYEGEDGRAENVLSLGGRFRSLLGYMPQSPGMYGNFTVSGFLWYIAALKDVASDRKRRERKRIVAGEIERLLTELDLLDAANRRISALSGGMRQRLGIAQALLGDPSIIILDEPTAGLDPQQRIAVRNLISRMALNKIVLIATHVVSDVEFIADKVIFLKKGAVVAFDSPAALAESAAGRVWQAAVEESEVGAFGDKHRVTAISRGTEGKVILRVLSEKAPANDAVPASPTLEDSYLNVFDEENPVV